MQLYDEGNDNKSLNYAWHCSQNNPVGLFDSLFMEEDALVILDSLQPFYLLAAVVLCELSLYSIFVWELAE